MKRIFVVLLFCMGFGFLVGCSSSKPVAVPTPCCRNPFHDHYCAQPALLWTEKITTDTETHTEIERFWCP